MATIYDVAKASGFSVATVSKVFNGYRGVNPQTKETVLIAARKLGYVVNANARTLGGKKSWLVGVIFKEEFGQDLLNPHFNEILNVFKRDMEQAGYDLLFINQSFSRQEMKFLEHCRYRDVDGVLLASALLDVHEANAIENAGIKCVSVENIYSRIPSVICDNKGGMFQGLSYLYFVGHRKIAMLSPPRNTIAGKERFSAYLEFMEAKGLPVDPRYVVESSGYDFASGEMAAELLFEQCADDFPTAIFAGYDHLAFMVQKNLLDKGFRIPDEVSIVGFDDLEVSRTATPSLTTIRQDRTAIGHAAASVMLGRLAGEEAREPTIRVPTRLIVRDSTSHVRE
jgi:LacI family transcriptional regulator